MDLETQIQCRSQTMIRIEGEDERGKGGRKARPVEYTDIGEHIEGVVLFKGDPIKFFIDKDDLEKVQTRQWYACVGGLYIGTHVNIDGNRKVLYLHNFVMNRLTFPGKGTTESVDHINRNGLDNRKENLRIVTQSMQNTNQRAKPRRSELPEGCGITLADLPKYVWYIKANGAHGDRFGIDIKMRKIKWKSSSSNSMTLLQKLEETKEKLREFHNAVNSLTV